MLSSEGPGCIFLYFCVPPSLRGLAVLLYFPSGRLLVCLLGCHWGFSCHSESSLFTEQRTTRELFSEEESFVLEVFQNSENRERDRSLHAVNIVFRFSPFTWVPLGVQGQRGRALPSSLSLPCSAPQSGLAFFSDYSSKFSVPSFSSKENWCQQDEKSTI